MSRGILAAWLVGLGLMTWRELEQVKRPPPPGRYLAASGLYFALGLLSDWPAAAPVAVTLAWGFDLAVFLQVLPEQAGAAGKTASSATSSAAPNPATGNSHQTGGRTLLGGHPQ